MKAAWGASRGETGDWENGEVHVERRRPRFDRQQFINQLDKFIVDAWQETQPKIPSREDVAKRFALKGVKPTTGAGVKGRLVVCEVGDDWDVYVRKVLKRKGLL